jgi:hypothetical protein
MIAALILALVAISAIGLATPRQADVWLGPRVSDRQRHRLRMGGFIVLLVSMAAALDTPDVGRAIVTWIGAIGLSAFLIALLLVRRSPRR